MDPDRAREVLARRRSARAQEAGKANILALCAMLRAFFYPKQAALFSRSAAKRKATKKTRRVGATVGGVREFVARALEQPGFRGTYVASTRIEARARAWENDTSNGFAQIARQFGRALERGIGVEAVDMAGIVVEIREAELALEFSNGSRIDLLGFDDLRALRKLRGRAKHIIWIDEAQDFRNLDIFYKAVVVGCLTDYDGECWLTGTPGLDCSGLFYEVTREDDGRAPGWEVHTLLVTDNPYFGAVMLDDGARVVRDNIGVEHGPYETEAEAEVAARSIRWERSAGQAIRDNGWSEDDPDALREWKAQWVKEDARFVLPVHAVPQHELVYAPHRILASGAPNGWDDFPDIVTAMRDLPGYSEDPRKNRPYFLSLGADLGTRDAFSFVLGGWSLQDPILYEVASWKRSGLDYDEMEQALVFVRGIVTLGVVRADAGGGGLGAVRAWIKRWNDRYSTPLEAAEKPPGYKVPELKQWGTDIRHRHFLFRDGKPMSPGPGGKFRWEGSPLLAEALTHRWARGLSASGQPVEDPATDNHTLDAGLYMRQGAYQHRFREKPLDPAPDSVEWTRREEDALAAYAVEQHQRDDWW